MKLESWIFQLILIIFKDNLTQNSFKYRELDRLYSKSKYDQASHISSI